MNIHIKGKGNLLVNLNLGYCDCTLNETLIAVL